MKSLLVSLSVGLGVAWSALPALSFPLEQVSSQQLPSDLNLEAKWEDKAGLLRAINQSLRYLDTPSAREAYADYPVEGITRDRAYRSLVRFRQLLRTSPTPEAFAAAIQQEFALYQAVGHDQQGTVHFTGYFEPVYAASRIPTSEYRYPIYRLPKNFKQWSSPHPTRRQLEGRHGEGKNSPLAGLEIAWLRDRLEAFLIHVQGSARLKLQDGRLLSVGYAGKTDHPYTSIGGELVRDGIFQRDELSLPRLIAYFQQHPEQLNTYLPRNQSFVFFRETQGAPATGSLGVPVTAERSIATDKSLMPPGALALLHTQFPEMTPENKIQTPRVSHYVLDQDTGSAIQGAGRVDIFMGTGKNAGRKAGIVDWTGQLYYLFLKE
ncbi:murein transglycosylase A [Halothece sp. PCC 7418]|uniref:murein transglycosylase A n=1 Tax=Halothece sp. (strain PCC 7418) TaxID=65093 RepID=UPI0005A271CB|nr:murein transglycosylase A [Halothece sp. PCC 7418]